MKKTAFFLSALFACAWLYAQQPPVPAGFVRVEGGTFQMGKIEYVFSDQRGERVHTVTVSSFNIGRHEVTQKEWHEVMGTTVRQQRDIADKSGTLMDVSHAYGIKGEGDNYPMYYVNWLEAVEYCNKRSLREGLSPAYRETRNIFLRIWNGLRRKKGNNIICDWNANGYRLPTEAEWEFAAKGGDGSYPSI